MKRLLVAILLVAASAAAAQTPSAQDMVAAADRARNPGQSFRLTSTLTDYVDGKPRGRVVLVVYSRDDPKTAQYSNLVRYAEPARDAGKLVLLAPPNMWFYDPASRASIRISPQQRLIGQASNGDVLTVNLARDYTAKLLGPETLQDAERKDRECWHLDLAAATPDAVYSRLEYWVERGTYRSVKAKFYADSGRLLKIAYYRRFEDQLGGLRPTETVIIDAVDAKLVTIIRSADYRYQEIAAAWFQRDFLPRLKAD